MRSKTVSFLLEVATVLLCVVFGMLLMSCTIFSNRWAVPHATPVRPCQGVYTYPDSAGTCEPKDSTAATHREEG